MSASGKRQRAVLAVLTTEWQTTKQVYLRHGHTLSGREVRQVLAGLAETGLVDRIDDGATHTALWRLPGD